MNLPLRATSGWRVAAHDRTVATRGDHAAAVAQHLAEEQPGIDANLLLVVGAAHGEDEVAVLVHAGEHAGAGGEGHAGGYRGVAINQ